MRYVLLLLILCVSFLVLNSITQYKSPLSFLSTTNNNTGASYGAPKPAHVRWATAAMMPLKGGPSQGTGLHSAPAIEVTPADRASAEAAVGTASSVVLAPMPSTSNPTHIQQQAVAHLAVQGGAPVVEASAPGAAATLVTSTEATTTEAASTKVSSTGVAATGVPAAEVATAEVAAPAVASPAPTVVAQDGPPMDAMATTDVQVMDLGDDVSLVADDLDLTAVPDVAAVHPMTAPFALSAEANAFALHISDSIRNSLMDPHGIQFGGIAGLNWSGASANASGDGHISGAPLTGITLGLFADIPLQKKLSFRPSLVYSFEGYQPNVNGQRENVHVAFLQAPLDLVYHTNLLGKRFFVGAGPYAAYGLSGTYTQKGIATDMVFGNNYNAGDDLRHLDYGANVMAGMLMDRNFILGATFDLGLHNIAPDGSAATIRTRSFGLSLGYVFRNRRNAPLSASAY